MSEMMGALRGKVTTAPPGFEAFAPVEAEAAAAPAYIGVPSPCFGRRTSPTDLLVPGGKRNHDLSALWKGRRTIAGEHRCKRRPWAKPVTSKQKSPICHLTSQWSGRLRAARFGAAHRRVRRHLYEVPQIGAQTFLLGPNYPAGQKRRSKSESSCESQTQ